MFYKTSLKYIFIISAAVAVLYPLINFYVIFPSFTRLLINNTEDEAVRLAQNLSSIVVSEKNELKEPAAFAGTLDKLKGEFKLDKLKVFLKSGEIIFSTDHEELGEINKETYFHEIVIKGDVYTKVVQKGTKSLEGKLLNVDAVETYVPIVRNGKILGAFEIYYDITQKNLELNSAIFRSSLVSFALVFSFFILIIIVLYRADRSTDELRVEQIFTIYQSPVYLLIVILISIFAAEGVIMYFLSTMPSISERWELILDSAFLVMLVSPLLYFFLMRPLVLNIKKRRQAEEELKKTNENLETIVAERTAELTRSKKLLEEDIFERNKIERKFLIQMEELVQYYKISGKIYKTEEITKEIKRLYSKLSGEKKTGND
jgi:hypothetical protein